MVLDNAIDKKTTNEILTQFKTQSAGRFKEINPKITMKQIAYGLKCGEHTVPLYIKKYKFDKMNGIEDIIPRE